MELLGSDQGKALLQIKTHLVAKNAKRTCPRPVLFFDPVLAHMTHQSEVLLHARLPLQKFSDPRYGVNTNMKTLYLGESVRSTSPPRDIYSNASPGRWGRTPKCMTCMGVGLEATIQAKNEHRWSKPTVLCSNGGGNETSKTPD